LRNVSRDQVGLPADRALCRGPCEAAAEIVFNLQS